MSPSGEQEPGDPGSSNRSPMISDRPEPCLSDQDCHVSDAELAWRVAYREWIETPDGPEEHDARMRLKAARQRLTWPEREGLWERYLADQAERTDARTGHPG